MPIGDYLANVSFGLIFLIILLGLLYFVVLMGYSVTRAMKTFPKGITRRLTEPRSHVDVPVRATGGTWNPGRPLGPGNRIPGPGRASYRLDEDGMVDLVFRSRAGHEERFSGPIPENLRSDSEVGRRNRRIRRRIYLLYAAFLSAGYAVAAGVARGPTFKRLDLGFIGVLVAMVAAQVLVLMVRVGAAGRSLTKESGKAPTVGGERRTPDR
jgi:hypothetical protein